MFNRAVILCPVTYIALTSVCQRNRSYKRRRNEKSITEDYLVESWQLVNPLEVENSEIHLVQALDSVATSS